MVIMSEKTYDDGYEEESGDLHYFGGEQRDSILDYKVKQALKQQAAVDVRRSTTPARFPVDSNPNGTNAVYIDKKTPKYEIIAVRERHGLFRKAVPCMPLSLAIILCLVNVIAPGVGTLISGFTVLCGCKTEHKSRAKAIIYNVIASVVQLTTAPIVIGWVWSIMWGVTFVNVSVSEGMDETIVATHL